MNVNAHIYNKFHYHCVEKNRTENMNVTVIENVFGW